MGFIYIDNGHGSTSIKHEPKPETQRQKHIKEFIKEMKDKNKYQAAYDDMPFFTTGLIAGLAIGICASISAAALVYKPLQNGAHAQGKLAVYETNISPRMAYSLCVEGVDMEDLK